MSDIATVKVCLSDEQMDVLLRDIGDLIGKVDALEQRISDVNDAALYDYAQLERRIDGNAEQIRKDWNAEFKHYGYLEERLTEVEERIGALERKLNHKSIETSGESIKIPDKSVKIGDGE